MCVGRSSSSLLGMFGAAAVRNKKRKAQQAQADATCRGPYIKPFGPRFDPNELPYFKYKRALAEAKELQHNISRAKKAKAKAAAKGADEDEKNKAALAAVSKLAPGDFAARLKVQSATHHKHESTHLSPS